MPGNPISNDFKKKIPCKLKQNATLQLCIRFIVSISFNFSIFLSCLFLRIQFSPKSVYKEGHCMSVKIHKFLLLLQPVLLADLPIHLSNIFLSMKRFQQIFIEVERKSNCLGGMKESSDVCLSFELFHLLNCSHFPRTERKF